MEKKNISFEEAVNSKAGTSHGENENIYRRNARRVKQTRKWLKISLASLISFLLIVTCTAAALVLPLIKKYQKAYVDVPIVSNPNISRPELPDITFDNSGVLIPPDDPDETEDPNDDPNDYVPPAQIAGGIYEVDKKDPNVENILLIGVDSRNPNSFTGRSDSMMVCSYNKMTHKATLVSLLRDTLVYIPGVGFNRLNAAFSIKNGGPALCINVINQTYDLDIQKFIVINFQGTVKLVNACGGVDLKLSSGERTYLTQEGGKYTKNKDGTYHLDGESALIHMRQRKGPDGGDDFRRTERQRNVIMAIFREVVSSSSLTQIYDLVGKACDMIKTNIPYDEITNLASSIVGNGAGMTIGSYSAPGKGNYAGVYYSFAEQKVVSSGGASVIYMNETQRKEEVKRIHGYLYGN